MVCLPADTKDVDEALTAALAPYDENVAVEPYQSYEDGSAEDYWLTGALRADLDGFRRTEVEGIEAVRAALVAEYAAKVALGEEPREKADKDIEGYRWAGEHADRI